MKLDTKRRNTRQRQIILEELKKVKSHPTADILFRTVRRRLPSVSFGTVYRNLNILRDEGKILELVCGKYSCRYDATTENHYHFICFKCKNVFDIDLPIIKHLNKRVSDKLEFQVDHHRIEFYGYCKRCKP